MRPLRYSRTTSDVFGPESQSAWLPLSESREVKAMKYACRAVFVLSLIAGLAAVVHWTHAQNSAADLEQGFLNPPDSAKPRTWWHWTNGNITKEGITKDLEWMKRVGIAGMQMADVSSGRGQTIEKKVEFGSPEWLDALRHAASEARRLGLEMTLFSSPGWSETGGPWVKPEQAMKKLVWSETAVDGPRKFAGKLPPPPSNNGPMRNLRTGGGRGNAPPDPTYYGDSVVLAYRTPAAEAGAADLRPIVTTNSGTIDAAALFDDDLNSTVPIPAPKGGGAAWVQFEFAQPYTARAITLSGRGGIPVGRVLAGNDGTSFRTLVSLPGAQLYRQGPVRTFAFPVTAAKYYRIEMTGAPLGPAATMSQAPSTPAAEYVLAEAVLHSGARVHRWEEKAGFSFLFEYESVPTPPVPAEAAVRSADIVDLTSKMASDGSLDWNIPPGKWTILRMGYSLTGSKNRPAMPTGLGYEADKLSSKHMQAYFHGYVDPITQSLGPLMGKGLLYMIMDSWEAGMQNWTDEMLGEFHKRRGYDATPYLPALAGRVVESAEVSDRFLWDFRRTLADMWADYHFGVMTDLLHQRGIGTYAEAAGVSLEIPEDTLLNKSKVDIPMGEFWVRDLHPRLMYYQDVRGAASAAHIYGKRLAAAESFTGGGYEAPYTLKQVGDYWIAQGINRIIFHTSAHQPLDTKPGNTMVGTHINRNITWAEQAKPFMTYLARSSFMLQQGLFVADLAFLLNEGAPSTMPFWGSGLTPNPPGGYDYDYINADVLLNRMSIGEGGRCTLPDGMSYRVLVLPQTDRMRPELLQKLRELVAGGATVVGPKPLRSPSMTAYPEADSAVQALAAELWGDLDGVSRTTRRYGKGTVIWGLPLDQILTSVNVLKDFEFERGLDADVAWLHRRSADADIYYVANLTDRAQAFDARFRVRGKEAELWHPDTGEIEPTGYASAGDRTIVPLHLDERELVFVVFRKAAAAPSRISAPDNIARLADLTGPWEVSFAPNLGAPAKLQFPELRSWTENTDEGVKYFSGTAIYTKVIEASKSWFNPGAKLLLDLGNVRDLAEVSVNGQAVALLWKPPYRMDVTRALQPGKNSLEIKVTNQWTNRLIGDRLALPEKRVLAAAGAAPGPMGAMNQALPASGLIGPVTLISRTNR
jgi:hypothetical protein